METPPVMVSPKDRAIAANNEQVMRVVSGQKPGTILEGGCDVDYIRSLGLEIVPIVHRQPSQEEIAKAVAEGTFRGGGVSPETYTVSKNETVTEAMKRLKLPDVPEIKDAMVTLLQKTGDMTVARALAEIWGGQIEAGPERSAIVGTLVGYPDHCVKYFMDTGWLNKPEDKESDDVGHLLGDRGLYPNPDHYARCPSCVRETAKKYQSDQLLAWMSEKGSLNQAIGYSPDKVKTWLETSPPPTP